MFQEDLQEWFDVYSLTDPTADENLQIEGLRASFGFIRDLIYEEAELLPDKRIILLGLSQGCAMGKSDSNFLFAIDFYLICWHQWVLSTLGNVPLPFREQFSTLRPLFQRMSLCHWVISRCLALDLSSDTLPAVAKQIVLGSAAT